MLTWIECSSLVELTSEEMAALAGRAPAPEFLDFLLAPYFYDEPLKDKPGVKDFIRQDIMAAQRRGSHDMSALLKYGLRERLLSQGYAGKIPEIPSNLSVSQ
jgi:hypothetical protein